jgi:hypothetical protein
VSRYLGILHVHSTLSDGAYTPRELREMAQARGLDFLVLCEHTKRLKPERRAWAAEVCGDAGDDDFLCVLGIECSYEGRHVVLLGPTELLCQAEDAEVVLEPTKARECGGMTIWAHPAATSYWSLRPGTKAEYDGWELWNRYVDGPVPSWPVLTRFQRQRLAGRTLLAFGAADFHDTRRHVLEPITEVEMPRLGAEELLDALRAGAYRVLLELPSNPTMSPAGEVLRSGTPGALYSRLRYVLVRLRSLAICLWRTVSGERTPTAGDAG